MRGPQSAQSVPYWQSGYSAPGPPSSQKPSEAYVGAPTHRLLQSVLVAGGGARGTRGPQSEQSVPYVQALNSEPGPPSSQSTSEE